MKEGKGKFYTLIGTTITALIFLLGAINDVLQFLQTVSNNNKLAIFITHHNTFFIAILIIVVIIMIIWFALSLRDDLIAKRERQKSEKQLYEFANELSRTMDSVDVPPYISEEMTGIIAKNSKNIEEYNAEKLRSQGIDPRKYQVFLAQKIARKNDMESCKNVYRILNEVVNCWTVFLNEEMQVVSYWTFISLKKESYEKIKTGKVNEKDLVLDDIRYIDVKGRYMGYLLLSGTIKELRTPEVVNKLYDSWIKYLEKLADRHGIYFEEISSMVGSVAGNSSLKGIGMEYYTDYDFGGKMYKYNLKNIRKINYLVKHYNQLETLYSKEFL